MITRRDFIKTCVTMTVLFPFTDVFASMGGDRILDMYNVHTDEKLNIRYCSSGEYDPEALEKINGASGFFMGLHKI